MGDISVLCKNRFQGEYARRKCRAICSDFGSVCTTKINRKCLLVFEVSGGEIAWEIFHWNKLLLFATQFVQPLQAFILVSFEGQEVAIRINRSIWIEEATLASASFSYPLTHLLEITSQENSAIAFHFFFIFIKMLNYTQTFILLPGNGAVTSKFFHFHPFFLFPSHRNQVSHYPSFLSGSDDDDFQTDGILPQHFTGTCQPSKQVDGQQRQDTHAHTDFYNKINFPVTSEAQYLTHSDFNYIVEGPHLQISCWFKCLWILNNASGAM